MLHYTNHFAYHLDAIEQYTNCKLFLELWRYLQLCNKLLAPELIYFKVFSIGLPFSKVHQIGFLTSTGYDESQGVPKSNSVPVILTFSTIGGYVSINDSQYTIAPSYFLTESEENVEAYPVALGYILYLVKEVSLALTLGVNPKAFQPKYKNRIWQKMLGKLESNQREFICEHMLPYLSLMPSSNLSVEAQAQKDEHEGEDLAYNVSMYTVSLINSKQALALTKKAVLEGKLPQSLVQLINEYINSSAQLGLNYCNIPKDQVDSQLSRYMQSSDIFSYLKNTLTTPILTYKIVDTQRFYQITW